jgi:hypothetical protein
MWEQRRGSYIGTLDCIRRLDIVYFISELDERIGQAPDVASHIVNEADNWPSRGGHRAQGMRKRSR